MPSIKTYKRVASNLRGGGEAAAKHAARNHASRTAVRGTTPPGKLSKPSSKVIKDPAVKAQFEAVTKNMSAADKALLENPTKLDALIQKTGDPDGKYKKLKNIAGEFVDNTADVAAGAAANKTAQTASKSGGAVKSTLEAASKVESTLSMGSMGVEMGGMAAVAGLGLAAKVSKSKKLEAAQTTLSDALGIQFNNLSSKLGVSETIEKSANPAIEWLGNAAESVTSALGIKSNRLASNYGKAEAGLDKVKKMLANIEVGEVSQEAQPHLEFLKKHLHEAESIGHVDITEVTHSLAEITKAHPDGMAKPLQRFAKKAGSMLEHYSTSKGWKNVGGNVKESLHGMSDMQVTSGVMHAGFVFGNVVGAGQGMVAAKDDLGSIGELYTDLTGDKNASITKIAMGPKLVRQQFWNKAKGFLLNEAAQAVGLVVNSKLLMNPHSMSGMKGMAFFMLPGMFAGMLTPEAKLTDMYKPLKDSERAGEDIPLEAIVGLITAVNSEIRDKPQQFGVALAEEYQKQGLKVDAIVKKAESGEMTADMYKLVEKHDAAKALATAGTAVAAGATENAMGDAVQGVAQEAVDKEVAKADEDIAGTVAEELSVNKTNEEAQDLVAPETKEVSHLDRLEGKGPKAPEISSAPKDVVGEHSGAVVDAQKAAKDAGTQLGAS